MGQFAAWRKKDVNLAAYQMAAEVMDQCQGSMRERCIPLSIRQEEIQETIRWIWKHCSMICLYGDRYSYKENGETFERIKMHMGLYDVSLDSMELVSGYGLSLIG